MQLETQEINYLIAYDKDTIGKAVKGFFFGRSVPAMAL